MIVAPRGKDEIPELKRFIDRKILSFSRREAVNVPS
jgi:hypothetical protein